MVRMDVGNSSLRPVRVLAEGYAYVVIGRVVQLIVPFVPLWVE